MSRHMLEIPVRPWMSAEHVSRVSEVSETALNNIRDQNHTFILLNGTWTLGRFGKSLDLTSHRNGDFKEALPNANAADIIGHPQVPLMPYQMSPEIGGTRAISRLRSRLNPIGVILYFTSNHTARDGKKIKKNFKKNKDLMRFLKIFSIFFIKKH